MAAMEVDLFRTGVHGQSPWFECHLLRRCNVSAALACCSRDQYGGALRCRCALAASTHHMRSSAKRGNALFKRLTALARRFAFGRQGLSDRADGDRAGDHHHPHLGECAVPGCCRPRTGQTSGRVAHDRGGPPEPLLEEMIREVFQSRLDAPVVFAGDEHEPVGAADLAGELFQGPRAPGPSDTPCTSGRGSGG